jgi:capsid protein
MRSKGRRASVGNSWNKGEALGVGGDTYDATNNRRKILAEMQARRGTPDQHLVPSLAKLQAQGAKLDCNTPYGRGAVEGFTAELIGRSIDVQPVGIKDKKFKKKIMKRWRRWCKTASVTGRSLWTLQRQAARSMPRTGGVLWRWVADPDKAKRGLPPVSIRALPAEWLSTSEVVKVPKGHTFAGGVELDRMGRAAAYHLSDPEEPGSDGERVDAQWITYVFEERLAGQSVGEPGLAPAVERIFQDGTMVVNELRAGTVANTPSVFTTSDMMGTEEGAEPITEMPIGSIFHGEAGETFHQIKSERPSTKVHEFRHTTRGDVAAITRTSQRWLDRDNARVNFSASRDDQLRSEKLIGPVQDEIGQLIAEEPWQRVAPYLWMLEGKRLPSDPDRREAVLAVELRPDVTGSANRLEAVKTDILEVAYGISSLQEVCARRGKVYDQVLEEMAEAQQDRIEKQLPPLGPDQLLLAIFTQHNADDAAPASQGNNL